MSTKTAAINIQSFKYLQMKTKFKIIKGIILIILISVGCDKIKKPSHVIPDIPALDTTSKCTNQVMAALITPANLQTILNTPGFTKIYLQFKTADDRNFFPAEYAGPYPYIDKSGLFSPFNLTTPFSPSKPYIFGTLKWEFSHDFTPDMSKQYYLLLPAIDPDGVHVTYSYTTIPYAFNFKDTSLTITDTLSLKNLSREQLDTLTAQSLSITTTSGTSKLNPCPPKTP